LRRKAGVGHDGVVFRRQPPLPVSRDEAIGVLTMMMRVDANVIRILRLLLGEDDEDEV
jgi:hypothetical protein